MFKTTFYPKQNVNLERWAGTVFRLPLNFLLWIPRRLWAWQRAPRNNAPIIAHGSVPRTSFPPVVQVGLAAALCSRLSWQQPDPQTTVRLPAAKSSNDRPLPLKQSQEHTGQRDRQKPGCLWGRGRQTKIHFCISQARVGRRLSAFHNKNPITSRSERSVLGCGSGSGFDASLFRRICILCRHCSCRFMHEAARQHSGLFFFIFSPVAQTASWDARQWRQPEPSQGKNQHFKSGLALFPPFHSCFIYV